MAKLRVGINGFGRIGRVFFRQIFDNKNIEIVAVHSRSDGEGYAHLLKFDSAYGKWNKDVSFKAGNFVVNGKKVAFLQGTEPGKDMWKKMKVDLVIESSGKLKSVEEAAVHTKAGAKYVVLTAPGKNVDGTFVHGINEKDFNPKKHKVISAASCTTTCTAMVVKVLDEAFSVEKGFINTIHAFTQDQSLHDSSHKDLRRARSAVQSIIPTSTGVTKALGELFPKLQGRFSGMSFRVPIIVPSIISATFILKKHITVDAVNKAFIKASKGNLKTSLEVSDLPLVSIDYLGMTAGATIDLLGTEVVNSNMVNVLAWYDNEWGYVANVIRLLEYIGRKI